jgi:hypothetical protein
MRRAIVAAAVVLAAVVAMGSPAYATIIIGGVTYVDVGLAESIYVPFAMPDAATSIQAYSGYVRIKVTGIGQSNGLCWNDAFWVFTDSFGAPVTPYEGWGGYQLNCYTSTLVGSIAHTYTAAEQIYYDVDFPMEVTARPYSPPYQASHEYNFVLKVASSTPSNLHFGVCDGIFGDNSGAYNIEVTQMTPEPSTFALLGVGAISLLAYAWRRRKTA